jgi:hypothetical protein
LGVNQLALKRFGAFQIRYNRLLVCASAENDPVVLDYFVIRFILNQVQFPLRVFSIADDFLYFSVKYDMLMKIKMISIGV